MHKHLCQIVTPTVLLYTQKEACTVDLGHRMPVSASHDGTIDADQSLDGRVWLQAL
jgi:hypothetical protein